MLWLLSLTACAWLKPSTGPPSQTGKKRSVSGGVVFKSDEYVIYQLKGHETISMLARAFLKDPRKAWVIEEENRGVAFKKKQFIVIPLQGPKKGGLSVNGYQVVPILCYHSFREKCQSSLCISRDAFEKQMAYLKTNGFQVITLAELADFLQYRHGLPDRSVVITFDDGYRSFYEIAHPILKKFNFTATLFIYTDFIGKSANALTWDHLRELKALGYEIGSHGVSHSYLTKREEAENDAAYLERIRSELIRSKAIIDEKLGQNTVCIAYPYGNYNQKILQLCEQAGYMLGFSVEHGANPFFADPLSLKRTQVLKEDLKHFSTRLNTFNRLSLK